MALLSSLFIIMLYKMCVFTNSNWLNSSKLTAVLVSLLVAKKESIKLLHIRSSYYHSCCTYCHVIVRVMNFLSSIKGMKKEDEKECYRAPAAPRGFFPDMCTGSSSVYSFGMAFYGRLGDGQQSIDKLTPEKLDCLERTSVKCVHIESAHTLVLLHSGDILSFGKCHFGQLGLGHEWMEAFSPQHIPLKVRICSIATGTHHSLAVSDQGALYTWGCGYNGCLGHGDEHMRSSPTSVEALCETHVLSVAGGEYHSLAIVRREAVGRGQQVYSWGKGHQGQLGNGHFESLSAPQCIESLQNLTVHKVVAAANFSSALVSRLLSEEEVEENVPMALFTWGSNTCGQLGHSADSLSMVLPPASVQDISSGMVKDEREKGVATPVELEHPGEFESREDRKMDEDKNSIPSCYWIDIASGGQHCLAVDSAGHLFAWGYISSFAPSASRVGECTCRPSRALFEAEEGQEGGRGEGTEPKVIGVACGTRHSFAFTAAGECFMAGSNSNGQLGLGGSRMSASGGGGGSFTRVYPEQFQGGGVVLTGDGGTNSSVLLVSNQVV